MQSVLSQAVLNLAHKYIANIEAGLSLGMWGGDVILNNLQLRLDALQPILPPHLKLTKGCIGNLSVHIPWASLNNTPVKIAMANIEVELNTTNQGVLIQKIQSTRAQSQSKCNKVWK
jgi:vacuolar protein sorting-associated protein 13B